MSQKLLTTENWQESDLRSTIFVKVSFSDGTISPVLSMDWISQVLDIKVEENVPIEIKKMFSVVQQTFSQGYHFYDLYTVSIEKILPIAELAIKEKCKSLTFPVKTFAKNIDYLTNMGIITPQEKEKWHTIRKLRNLFAHPNQQNVLTPPMVISTFQLIIANINNLFT